MRHFGFADSLTSAQSTPSVLWACFEKPRTAPSTFDPERSPRRAEALTTGCENTQQKAARASTPLQRTPPKFLPSSASSGPSFGAPKLDATTTYERSSPFTGGEGRGPSTHQHDVHPQHSPSILATTCRHRSCSNLNLILPTDLWAYFR